MSAVGIFAALAMLALLAPLVSFAEEAATHEEANSIGMTPETRSGKLAKLDKAGKVVKAAEAEADGFPNAKAAGIATSKQDLFVSFGTGGAHRVVRYDRDGAVLSKWGSRDRTGLEGFGSCCNPMNIIFGPEGALYTSEAGVGRLKRYTPDGKFLGLVGHIDAPRFSRAGGLAISCSNIELAVTKDQARVYVMDLKKGIIRVLMKK